MKVAKLPNTKPNINPQLMARIEAGGWKAYYDRNWFKMLWLLVQMCNKQFKMPLPVALLGSFYVTRGSIAWVPKDHNLQNVQRYYTKFYRLASRYCGFNYEPERVAKLEVEYYLVHRKLLGKPDKQELIQVMTELHSAIFGLAYEQTRESAELRVEANNTVDLITSHNSANAEQDWSKIEKYLTQCYQSIQHKLN